MSTATTSAAIDAAHRSKRKAVTDRPSLICCKTVIGKGAPNKAGIADAHGAALGEKEVAATRANIGWPYAPFEIPEAMSTPAGTRAQGAALRSRVGRAVSPPTPGASRARARVQPPHGGRIAGELRRRCGGRDRGRQRQGRNHRHAQGLAELTLDALAPELPELIGGSADLTGSVFTNWSGSEGGHAQARPATIVNFGVREFGMAAITNGMALHGGFIP